MVQFEVQCGDVLVVGIVDFGYCIVVVDLCVSIFQQGVVMCVKVYVVVVVVDDQDYVVVGYLVGEYYGVIGYGCDCVVGWCVDQYIVVGVFIGQFVVIVGQQVVG